MGREPWRQDQRWWPWWWQAKDAVALTAGVGLVATEAWRGTYNPIAMSFAAACFGVIAWSTLSRWALSRAEKNGK